MISESVLESPLAIQFDLCCRADIGARQLIVLLRETLCPLVAGRIRIVAAPPAIIVGSVCGCCTSAIVDSAPIGAAFYSAVDTRNTARREWTSHSGFGPVERQCWSRCRRPVQGKWSSHNERASYCDRKQAQPLHGTLQSHLSLARLSLEVSRAILYYPLGQNEHRERLPVTQELTDALEASNQQATGALLYAPLPGRPVIVP
jgi:hypothetical protein